MKHKYFNYYQNYSFFAPVVFAWDALHIKRGAARRMSLVNRLSDYLGLYGKPKLFSLHQKINECLFFSPKSWSSHDYGEGYFYQSFKKIGLKGLRDTESRVAEMNLDKLVRNKSIIDIGCNTGFVSLSAAKIAREVVGFDNNPNLVAVANIARDHLGYGQAEFLVSSFEDFDAKKPADIIFSFANHSTYDGNTKQSPEEYFNKCRNLLKPRGLLIFESHHHSYEKTDTLERVCSLIDALFLIRERRILSKGTFFDRGRTFIVAEKRSN